MDNKNDAIEKELVILFLQMFEITKIEKENDIKKNNKNNFRVINIKEDIIKHIGVNNILQFLIIHLNRTNDKEKIFHKFKNTETVKLFDMINDILS